MESMTIEAGVLNRGRIRRLLKGAEELYGQIEWYEAKTLFRSTFTVFSRDWVLRALRRDLMESI